MCVGILNTRLFCNALDFIIGAAFIGKIIDCKLYVRMLKLVHHAVYTYRAQQSTGGRKRQISHQTSHFVKQET